MELRVIGSSSAGNAYVLESASESLLVECGMIWSSIQTGMEYRIGKCVGCLISHEHGDHSKSVRKVIEHMIPVYTSAGTAQALHIDDVPMVHSIPELRPVKIGSFDVIPFPTQHDAAEPFGFLIRHPECGTILFATDTYYLQFTFPKINHMMIECNYIQSILDANTESGTITELRRNRTIKSHLSLETLLDIIAANDMTGVRNIVLIHLSPDNADEQVMKQVVTEHTGTNVIVAKQGIKLNLNNNPF